MLRNAGFALVAAVAVLSGSMFVASAQDEGGSTARAPTGLTLEKGKQAITSAERVDLTRDFATLPLHKGTAGGETVWFVITDVSDPLLARKLGVNHSPKLSNISRDCPACSQTVKSSDPVLGEGSAEFEGAPDFSPTRTLVPGPSGFPAQSFSPGAIGGPNYSPFVTVEGSGIVYNAPIVATGEGPFDVTTHSDTHDRALAIDTENMTVDLLFVRGFANGQPILYLSFESSDAFTADLERSTFVPALIDAPFANGGGEPESARASIFTFVNAKSGLEDNPPARGAAAGKGRNQGLTHAMTAGLPGLDAAVANPEVLEVFRSGADVSNIFDIFPTNVRAVDREEYSPLWDLQVGVYSPDAVAKGLNGLKTDANVVRSLAARGLITGPGEQPLGSANVLINCPALGFLESPPEGPRTAVPGVTP
ncbi:MAG: hypothetical protein H0U42_02225 [Thermoleophilaceae bacterium]|nr:hypothetical protein [Thermoleophilaceae bacterium]